MVRMGSWILLWAWLVAPVEAHHSASAAGPLYYPRYIVCRAADATDRIQCVGPAQARAAIPKALALVRGHAIEDWADGARTTAVWAAYFGAKEAIPPLRTWLGIEIEAADRDSHVMLTKQALQAEAAFALARLGDTASTAKIAALVRTFETTGYGSLWADTLAALAELDPAAASRYALDFVSRWKTTDLPGGSSALLALDYIRSADAERARPILAKAVERHPDDLAYCELMATRVRLDPEVHATVRELFVDSYGGSWLAGCAERVMARFGDDPADATALVRHLGRQDGGLDFGMTNLAYLRVLELERVIAKRHDSAAIQARQILRGGLTERASWSYIADPTSASYTSHYAALHTVALAGVGDPDAIKRLPTVLAGTSDTAWLAALYDLELGLPGAVDRAADLVARSVGQGGAEKGSIFEAIHSRVLDAFVARAPDDGRWAVGLLDRDADAQEHALALLSRRTPKRACEAVTAAARNAPVPAAEFAFLGLATQSCNPALGALAEAKDAPAAIRGTAIEVLAAFDAPDLCAHLRTGYRDGVPTAPLERATRLRHPACGK